MRDEFLPLERLEDLHEILEFRDDCLRWRYGDWVGIYLDITYLMCSSYKRVFLTAQLDLLCTVTRDALILVRFLPVRLYIHGYLLLALSMVNL